MTRRIVPFMHRLTVITALLLTPSCIEPAPPELVSRVRMDAVDTRPRLVAVRLPRVATPAPVLVVETPENAALIAETVEALENMRCEVAGRDIATCIEGLELISVETSLDTILRDLAELGVAGAPYMLGDWCEPVQPSPANRPQGAGLHHLLLELDAQVLEAPDDLAVSGYLHVGLDGTNPNTVGNWSHTSPARLVPGETVELAPIVRLETNGDSDDFRFLGWWNMADVVTHAYEAASDELALSAPAAGAMEFSALGARVRLSWPAPVTAGQLLGIYPSSTQAPAGCQNASAITTMMNSAGVKLASGVIEEQSAQGLASRLLEHILEMSEAPDYKNLELIDELGHRGARVSCDGNPLPADTVSANGVACFVMPAGAERVHLYADGVRIESQIIENSPSIF